jgi:hypothetical protein
MLRLRGREKPFEGEEIETHVATIRVVLSYDPSQTFGFRYRESDLRCVADRAVHAAAAAYNFHSTRIVAVELVDIVEVEADAS